MAPDLSAYRSVNAARGLHEIQARLDDGWDILHLDFCEEVRQRRGIGGQSRVIAWTPYAIMGRTETLAQTDRDAIALADDRRAAEAGVPLGDDAPAEEAPAEVPVPPAPPEEKKPIGHQPRGRRITAASPASAGFEGLGGLANR